MKAVLYEKRARPGKLVFTDCDKPVPSEQEILLKIHSVSLNAADYRSMKMGMIPRKKIFGADVAGTVEAVGKSVTRFRIGDEVLGDLASFGFGGLAEYVAAPEIALICKPESISFEEAACMPMAALTALQAFRKHGKISTGHKVLIVGSGGGVGTFATQLARHFGAEVTGVCSTKNVQQTLSLGADHVIDYNMENFADRADRFDLILGINGNYPLFTYRKSLAPKGTYVMVGGSLSQIFKSLVFGRLLSFGSKKMTSLAAKANRQDLEFLAKLMEERRIRAVIERRFSLEQAPEAMHFLSQGHSSGKVVINVAKD